MREEISFLQACVAVDCPSGPRRTEKNRSVDDTDVVVWYNLGITHQVRPEDYPLMPVHTAGFSIAPFGFFTENPAMDVSPPAATDRDGGRRH